jgi:hypothetical protein
VGPRAQTAYSLPVARTGLPHVRILRLDVESKTLEPGIAGRRVIDRNPLAGHEQVADRQRRGDDDERDQRTTHVCDST